MDSIIGGCIVSYLSVHVNARHRNLRAEMETDHGERRREKGRDGCGGHITCRLYLWTFGTFGTPDFVDFRFPERPVVVVGKYREMLIIRELPGIGISQSPNSQKSKTWD